MKIIHTADIHLGSKLEFAKTKEIRDELRRVIRKNFNNLVEYAKDNNIKVILISGDLFDSDYPLEKDKDYFYNLVKENDNIDFIYLRGNHDKFKDNSGILNLKTFKEEVTTYIYDDIAISGLEFNNANYDFYNKLNLNPNYKNILMLHGDIKNDVKPYVINLDKLKNKNINYLALGHIHMSSIARTNEFCYAYPGCLTGRSFDEIGPKGFIVLDTTTMTPEFIKYSHPIFSEEKVDISDTSSDYSVSQKLRQMKFNKDDLYQIVLTGDIDFNLDLKEIETNLSDVFYFVTLKDKTQTKIDYTNYKNDKGLKGEFIRLVLDDKTLTTTEKNIIIKRGLKALKGEVEDETC